MAFMTDLGGESGKINLAGVSSRHIICMRAVVLILSPEFCNGPTLPNSELLDCSALGPEIQDCQKAGKLVTLSLGGATGKYTLTSEDEAKKFGETFYNNFLGGSSSTRPFGKDVVLDGCVGLLSVPDLHLTYRKL